MRIGFDLDGVLYDFTDGLRRSVPQELRGPDATRWNFFNDWGISNADFPALAREGVRNRILFWTGSPLPGAITATNVLKEAGHEIVIITHRGVFGEGLPLSREATKYWLTEYGITYDELILSEDKTVGLTDFMIDDKVENYEALRAAGTQGFLMNQLWNAYYETEHRIHTLEEFVKICLKA